MLIMNRDCELVVGKEVNQIGVFFLKLGTPFNLDDFPKTISGNYFPDMEEALEYLNDMYPPKDHYAVVCPVTYYRID